ncbi:MAG TPA: Holliday junction resolvase RuvX [Candidatus Limnocylindria bacterium]|nr:Holliday junction resolvase RuvX [Candidatus Limnocylindria bacterium]
MRYLALDLGDRRIGLAVGDDEAGVARALPALHRRSQQGDLDVLRRVIHDEGVQKLLIGLPVTLRGEEGPQAERTRALAERLGRDLGLPVELRDERLTTKAAARYRTGKRFDLDSAAAALLLQERLDQDRRS